MRTLPRHPSNSYCPAHHPLPLHRYVLGAAVPAAKTPGERDANNVGKTLDDFIEQANTFIRKRRNALRATDALQLPEEHAYLTRDEVIAVRIYSGPAYQPINEFLRAVGQLQVRPQS